MSGAGSWPNIDQHILSWLDDLIQKGQEIPRDSGGNSYSWPHYHAWCSQVEHCLIELLGPNSVYYIDFASKSSPSQGAIYPFIVETALGILRAVREDYVRGRLFSLRALVTAEVFADFLDMASHLADNGYKDAAASLSGAVLERGMRDMARANDVTVGQRDDLSALNNRLAQKNVYSRLVQKNVAVWVGVRNHADHGEFEKYDVKDVRLMIDGIRDFLAQRL